MHSVKIQPNTIGSFTLQKELGLGPSKKWYRPITFVLEILEFLQGHWSPMALRKLQYFFTKVAGLYYVFGGSRPKFFCSVNAPSVDFP